LATAPEKRIFPPFLVKAMEKSLPRNCAAQDFFLISPAKHHTERLLDAERPGRYFHAERGTISGCYHRVIVPTLCVGMQRATLCVIFNKIVNLNIIRFGYPPEA